MRTHRDLTRYACRIMHAPDEPLTFQPEPNRPMERALTSLLSTSTHGPKDSLVLTRESLKILLSGGIVLAAYFCKYFAFRARSPRAVVSAPRCTPSLRQTYRAGSPSWRSL